MLKLKTSSKTTKVNLPKKKWYDVRPEFVIACTVAWCVANYIVENWFFSGMFLGYTIFLVADYFRRKAEVRFHQQTMRDLMTLGDIFKANKLGVLNFIDKSHFN